MALGLGDIKNFVTVSQTLNVTRASEILGLTQPALSYSLKRLELELDGELLIRLKSGVQLTKLGENFLNRSRRLIFEWEELQRVASPDSGLVEGIYTLAVHPSVALYTLDKFIPQLTKSYPTLDLGFIHGLSREMTEKVISWEADLGIVVNPVRHPDLVIKKLCTDEVAIFHRAQAPVKLIWDKGLHQGEQILKQLSAKNSFNHFIHSPNLEVVAKLTALGQGYGILPTRVAALFPKLKKMQNSPIFKDEICLIYRPEKAKCLVFKKIVQLIANSRYE